MFTNSHISERAIREIYARNFQIVVEESQPMSLMTSYNLVNGIHSANNEDSVTRLLRNEWGFQGMVISDFDGGYGYMLSDAAVRAGNDLMLATTQPLAGALDPSSATLVNALRQASKNILYTVGNSGYYRDFAAEEAEAEAAETAAVPATGSSMNNMDRIFKTVNTITIALCAALMILVWLRWFLKKSKK